MDDINLNVAPSTETDMLRSLFGDTYSDGDAENTNSEQQIFDDGYGVIGGEIVPFENSSEGRILAATQNDANDAGENVAANVDVVEGGLVVGDDNGNVDYGYLPYTAAEIFEGPKQGMIFDTLELLYDFYMAHGKSKGFAIRKRSNHKFSEDEGLSKYVYLCCDKARSKGDAKTSKRCDCRARLSAKLRDDLKYEVKSVFHEHSRSIDSSLSRFMPDHRHVSRSMKRRLEANDLTGIRIAKNIRMEEVHAGGPDRLGCLSQDCRNFINSTRRLTHSTGDAEAMRKFFCDMQQHDSEFFHVMDVDVEGRLRNVIWVHPQEKAAYKDFHDVVSFDTTYLLNKYKMPFASFVGVNHHRQSILQGCALLSHEDTDTFRWLFRTWLTAMGNVQPTGIMADQCESIKAAIYSEMPNTVHRFCLWHIFTKVPMKFKRIRGRFKEAKAEFMSMVFNSLTREEFDARWNQFLNTYEMQGNDWLTKLFDERDKWAPVYLHDFFWAGMKSTQRSEGMRAFFDGYLNRGSTLQTFVTQYEVALRNKHEKELAEEFKSRTTSIACESGFAWEVQLQGVLTQRIFKLLQFQINRTLHCEITSSSNIFGTECFQISDTSVRSDYHGNVYTYTVEYRSSGEYLQCNCKMFETMGVLCRHILRVIIHKRITRIPEQYIPRRRRKDVPRTHLKKFLTTGYPNMSVEYKTYKEIIRDIEMMTDVAMDDMAKMRYMKEIIASLKHDIFNWKDSFANAYAPEPATVTTEGGPVAETNPRPVGDSTSITDPAMVGSRGRPRASMYPSSYDHIARRGGRVSRGGTSGGV